MPIEQDLSHNTTLMESIEKFLKSRATGGFSGPYDRENVAHNVGEEEQTVALLLGKLWAKKRVYRRTVKELNGKKLYWGLEDNSCPHLQPDPWPEDKPKGGESPNRSLTSKDIDDWSLTRKNIEDAAPIEPQTKTLAKETLSKDSEFPEKFTCSLSSEGKLRISSPQHRGVFVLEVEEAQQLFKYLLSFNEFPSTQQSK
jgi:hypothetical protein